MERTSRALLGKVFPGFGKVSGKAAEAVFSAVVRTGSALVTDIAASMDGDATSRKGLLCAAVVLRRRATPLRFDLLRGGRACRTQRPPSSTPSSAPRAATASPVHDRGFDSERFVAHALRSGHRAVVRAKELSRDVFGTGDG